MFIFIVNGIEIESMNMTGREVKRSGVAAMQRNDSDGNENAARKSFVHEMLYPKP